MLSASVAWMRGGGASLPFVLVWSLPAHLMVSMGIFVLMQWIWAVAASFRRARRVELVLIQVMLAVFLWLIVRGILASSATFSGPLAEVYAAVLAVGVSAFWAKSAALRNPDIAPQSFNLRSGPVSQNAEDVR